MPATARRQGRRGTSATSPERRALADPGSDGAVALTLLSLARERGRDGIVHVGTSDSGGERLARILWQIAPDVDAIPFPAWDCIPYDRLSPSARVQGLRVTALTRLADGSERPWILLATSAALIQTLPPPAILATGSRTLGVGEPVFLDELRSGLRRIGYAEDDRVDEPGEFAIRGQVIDIFPAGYALPVRVEHGDGRIGAVASYDPRTQRTSDGFDRLIVRPISEAILPDDAERGRGVEHRLPELYDHLATLTDYAPAATFVFAPDEAVRRQAFREQIEEAHESRNRLRGPDARPLRPSRLYLDDGASAAMVATHRTVVFEPRPAGDIETVPSFALAAKPGAALSAFLTQQRDAGRRIVLAAAEPELTGLERRVARQLDGPPRRVVHWAEIASAEPGTVLSVPVSFPGGFLSSEGTVAVVTATDLLGSRASGGEDGAVADLAGFGDDDFHVGDAVIHLDHGVGQLEGLESVPTGTGEPVDTVRLRYAGDAILMVPVDDIDMMWRYGSAAQGVSLDRLDGGSWPQRRAKVEREIDAAARELARVAADRRRIAAPKLVPPRAVYERFVARFPFTDTPGQRRAVGDILADLACGHTMNRLVCGDVGFGKTEVALRAAAAAALAGKQVAIVAPTTVLVRQHLDTFTRRFADLGIAVGHLSRLVGAADARAVKEGLSNGEIRIAIGTHALAATGVRFADLGLLIVDEEQRFGAADKAKLRALGDAVHVLTLTATPIPRTMQAALVGLQDVSVLATPPAERQPVRTTVSDFDEVVVRDALLREHRRSGQSFVVCPQIEDLAPMAERLGRLAPELTTVIAHGKLPAAAIDDIMVRFANQDGDVLLATNIIESGLDVPRANTIVVWRADRFGLAQLHQLRGRVGRGRTRGAAYLTTDPDTAVPEATLKRLRTLERLDRLGAGFAISQEDLDQRGAGDLMGDTQAGHVRLIGAGLYRRLLDRALKSARGEGRDDEWLPEIHIGASGRLPPDYVPEPEVRLNLYARIARAGDARSDTQLADEIEDRFGPRPAPVEVLLSTARLRRLCREAGIVKVDAGPQAIAVTFKQRGLAESALAGLVERAKGALTWKGGRLVFGRKTADLAERAALAQSLLRKVRSTIQGDARAAGGTAAAKAGDKAGRVD